jgi:hypothetical protein
MWDMLLLMWDFICWRPSDMNTPPKPIPLNPENPRSKKVDATPMPKLYADRMEDDLYIRPDNDSVYKPIDKTVLNDNENTQNSN